MSSLNHWSDFCRELALEEPRFTYSIRKIVPNVIFETPLDDSIKLTNVGFKEGGSKITMLKKYYSNPESIKKAQLALEKIANKNDFGSVAFSTIGQEKKFTHHQHCIQSISIRHHPGGKLEYTVFYRAAEMIKIFTGDMVFIRDFIQPLFGPGKVTFFFSNATLNAMYCPIMFIHKEEDWIKMLRVLRFKDISFFNRFKKWTEMYFSDEVINYSSAEVIRELIHRNLNKRKRKEILDEFKKYKNR